ncbi:MAG TPA: RNA polymerase subunit sigma-24, partial [Mycobacteriales bacterium]|nr:RNA polymerase subunit sigma-24 [Mycobacteriales bacterium]
RAAGPAAGLAILRDVDATSLAGSPLIPSVRGDLLELSGQYAEAASAFAEAAALTRNGGERAVLQRRAEENRRRAAPA